SPTAAITSFERAEGSVPAEAGSMCFPGRPMEIMPDTDKKPHGWQKNRKPHSGFLPRLCLLVTEQRMTSCGVFKGSLGMVAFGLAVVLWLAMSAASPSLASDDKEVWFHIPKQRADIALTTFAKQ